MTFLTLVMILLCFKAAAQEFQPDWKSLGQYKVPDWFKDAKFGIFMHWGVQSVPAFDGWYARDMYMEGSSTYDYHVNHYGHPSKIGYKDLIPLWIAESWNPDSLVRFYRKIGAKYIVYVAVHHDNFDNYASTYQPWNSVNMGPHMDIVKRWASAARKFGLRFGVSSHSDRSWNWFVTSHGSDSTGSLTGVPYDGDLTANDGDSRWWSGFNPQDLYSVPHSDTDPPDSAYCVKWYMRTKELIDKYHPDLLYFDGPMPVQAVTGWRRSDEMNLSRVKKDSMENYGMRIAAYFYNANRRWHNGRLDAVLNLKSWLPGSVPDHSAVVMDVEKGQSDSLCTDYWQTDTSLNGNWFYSPGPLDLSDTVVVQNLCDIASKNGNLLLNVSLRADGSLPDDQSKLLLNVGRWLDINGKAIYGTRPWKIFGEGPTKVQGGDFKENRQPFTSGDIRFTTKGAALFAIIMGWPEDGKILIHSLKKGNALEPRAVKKVEMLGTAEKLKWETRDDGLMVVLPSKRPSDFASVLRITFAK
jgi:alpha-L-fucosidase